MDIPDHVIAPAFTAAAVAGADVEELHDARIVDATAEAAAMLGCAEGVRQAAKLVATLGPDLADVAATLTRHSRTMRQDFLASVHPDVQASASENPVEDDHDRLADGV